MIYAITVHEVAHGWVAKKLGDDTASRLGRLSLNPVKHVDPIGTVLVPVILYFVSGTPFGWAKPVPVNFKNLNNPKQDMAWVALAGPFANLCMLIIWGILLKFAASLNSDYWNLSQMLIHVADIGIMINMLIMLLNLIPIPPLDGSRVVASLLPVSWERNYLKIEPLGIALVILLFMSGYLFKILAPAIAAFRDLVFVFLAM